jgi:hypothetical protein
VGGTGGKEELKRENRQEKKVQVKRQKRKKKPKKKNVFSFLRLLGHDAGPKTWS